MLQYALLALLAPQEQLEPKIVPSHPTWCAANVTMCLCALKIIIVMTDTEIFNKNLFSAAKSVAVGGSATGLGAFLKNHLVATFFN